MCEKRVVGCDCFGGEMGKGDMNVFVLVGIRAVASDGGEDGLTIGSDRCDAYVLVI